MNKTINDNTWKLTISELGYYYFISQILYLLLSALKSIPKEHLSIKLMAAQGQISEVIFNDEPKACLDYEIKIHNLNSYSIESQSVEPEGESFF